MPGLPTKCSQRENLGLHQSVQRGRMARREDKDRRWERDSSMRGKGQELRNVITVIARTSNLRNIFPGSEGITR